MYLDENGLSTFWEKIKSWSNDKLDDKADSSNVYTKLQVDQMIDNIDSGALHGDFFGPSSITDTNGQKWYWHTLSLGTSFKFYLGYSDYTYYRNLCVYFPLPAKVGTFYGAVASLGKPYLAASWQGGDYWTGQVSYMGTHPSFTDRGCLMIPINTETTNAAGINSDKIRVSVIAWCHV